MFITVEGIEGSGKTTQLPGIVRWLQDRGFAVTATREPGSTRLGRRIREILLDAAIEGMDPLAELMLYMADRAQHVAKVVRPALDAGGVVVCDRYADATFAYQGFGRGLDMGLLTALHRKVLNDLKPDLTLLFDLPVETGLKRAWAAVHAGDRDEAQTRFEKEAAVFHHRVRDGYLTLAKADPDRYEIIDAAGDEATVASSVTAVLERRFASGHDRLRALRESAQQQQQ